MQQVLQTQLFKFGSYKKIKTKLVSSKWCTKAANNIFYFTGLYFILKLKRTLPYCYM